MQSVYKNCLGIEIDNKRTSQDNDYTEAEEDKQPIELFADFFKMQNNVDMSDEEIEIMEKFIKEALDE